MGILSQESNSFIFIFASQLIRGQFLKKRICSPKSKFFPLRVDPIWKGLHCPGRQTGSHKNCFLLLKGQKNMLVYPFTLISGLKGSSSGSQSPVELCIVGVVHISVLGSGKVNSHCKRLRALICKKFIPRSDVLRTKNRKHYGWLFWV